MPQLEWLFKLRNLIISHPLLSTYIKQQYPRDIVPLNEDNFIDNVLLLYFYLLYLFGVLYSPMYIDFIQII